METKSYEKASLRFQSGTLRFRLVSMSIEAQMGFVSMSFPARFPWFPVSTPMNEKQETNRSMSFFSVISVSPYTRPSIK